MLVTLEGHVTSVIEKSKDDKKYTEIMLAQPGETEQVRVRMDGHMAGQFDLFEKLTVTGKLVIWKTRDGVGKMVMVDGNDGNG